MLINNNIRSQPNNKFMWNEMKNEMKEFIRRLLYCTQIRDTLCDSIDKFVHSSRKCTYLRCFQYISSGVKRPQLALTQSGYESRRERKKGRDQANRLRLDDSDLGQGWPRRARGGQTTILVRWPLVRCPADYRYYSGLPKLSFRCFAFFGYLKNKKEKKLLNYGGW